MAQHPGEPSIRGRSTGAVAPTVSSFSSLEADGLACQIYSLYLTSEGTPTQAIVISIGSDQAKLLIPGGLLEGVAVGPGHPITQKYSCTLKARDADEWEKPAEPEALISCDAIRTKLSFLESLAEDDSSESHLFSGPEDVPMIPLFEEVLEAAGHLDDFATAEEAEVVPFPGR